MFDYILNTHSNLLKICVFWVVTPALHNKHYKDPWYVPLDISGVLQWSRDMMSYYIRAMVENQCSWAVKPFKKNLLCMWTQNWSTLFLFPTRQCHNGGTNITCLHLGRVTVRDPHYTHTCHGQLTRVIENLFCFAVRFVNLPQWKICNFFFQWRMLIAYGSYASSVTYFHYQDMSRRQPSYLM